MGRKLPETCTVVTLIKLEFGVSVGFIHKESVTMHGHTILKLFCLLANLNYLQWFLELY